MKLGLRNFLMVGVMAVLFIVVAKVLTSKYQIPGVTPVIQSV